MPTAEASQWVEATAPKVPRISGRVVKAAIVCSPAGRRTAHRSRLDHACPSAKRPPIAIGARGPYLSRGPRLSPGAPIAFDNRKWTRTCPRPLPSPSPPAPTTPTSGEEFFRIEGAYTGLGAPIPGGEVGRWLLRRRAADRQRGRAVRRAVLAAARRRCAVVARQPPYRHLAPADPRHRRALVARAQGDRGLPHPARLGGDRRIPAEPDPRHDRARNAVPPPPRPPGRPNSRCWRKSERPAAPIISRWR